MCQRKPLDLDNAYPEIPILKVNDINLIIHSIAKIIN